MEPVLNIQVRGRRSSRYECGNISVTLKQRFEKRYRVPSSGREIILEDFRTSPYHFPPIQFPPNALTSPVFLFQTFTTILGLGQEICIFLQENISDTALALSNGGLCGFHLIAVVEVVHTEVVENIEVAGGRGDRRDNRVSMMTMKTLSRNLVKKLLMKRKRDVKPGETCAVCLDEFEGREVEEGAETGVVVTVVMPCDHLFHASCISRWFEKSISCPLCRRGIKRDDIAVGQS